MITDLIISLERNHDIDQPTERAINEMGMLKIVQKNVLYCTILAKNSNVEPLIEQIMIVILKCSNNNIK